MNTSVFQDSFLRRIPALVLVGLFLFVATGIVHSCTEDHHDSEKTPHVFSCKCACHHHLIFPYSEQTRMTFDLSESQNVAEYQNSFSDAEPFGIFRPPKHLV